MTKCPFTLSGNSPARCAAIHGYVAVDWAGLCASCQLHPADLLKKFVLSWEPRFPISDEVAPS